jgi:hypothetical protein
MSQQRIPFFFYYISRKKTSPDAKCHFLELPFKIRLQIYHEAGLVSGRMIHLNHWSPSKRSYDNPRMWESGYEPRHWDPWGDARRARTSLPVNLFAVCRCVYDELRGVLYGENRFVISRKLLRGLRALEHLSDATLREIRFLTIRVNVSSCENFCCGGRDACGNAHSCRSPITAVAHDAPLGHSSDADQLVISQWRQICTQLARSLQPSKLALYIICDCADAATAQMVIKPLLLLPTLQDCGIRLAMHSDEKISALAKDVVLCLTSSPRPGIPPPFRFLDLPKEIQRHILEFTTLINYTVKCWPNRLDYGVRCRKRGSIAEDNDPMSVDPRPLLHCFCGYAHSAFNFRCKCRDEIFPYSMFFVSREFRDAAMQIFYGQNEFIVSMEGFIPEIPLSSPPYPHLDRGNAEVSIVPGLAYFPHSSIKYLTKLVLDFAWHELEYLQPNGTGWKHWLETINLLDRDANLGALNVELHFNESFYPDLWTEKPTFDPEYEGYMLQAYKNFIRPMNALRGLKKLFIYLHWNTSFELPDRRPEHEGMLEKMMMGETYDAWKHGKVFRYPGPLDHFY